MAKSKSTPKTKNAPAKRPQPRARAARPAKAAPSGPVAAPSAPIKLAAATQIAPAEVTVHEGAAPAVRTIVYVHGIGNKPAASVLKCQWDSALFGTQLGDRSRMAYWVNREYYPTPLGDTCASGDVVSLDDDEASTRAIMALSGNRPLTEENALATEIEAIAESPAEREWLRRVGERMIEGGRAEVREAPGDGVRAKILPLPGFLRRLITQQLTRAYLRDVNDFFFHPDRRARMEQSLVDRLAAGGGPFIVIGHSQGSMIAYNVLRQLTKQECDVRLFVTIGSPLGIQEVQDLLRQWTGGPLPVPPCVSQWVNVADRLDPVAADPELENDFAPKKTIKDTAHFFYNPDSPRHPHSGTGYLRTAAVQNAVRSVAGNAFGQAVGQAVVLRDLVQELENGRREERHEVLIQLAGGDGSPQAKPISEVREELSAAIERLVVASGDEVEAARIEPLKRYVAARLNRREIERLRTQFQALDIQRIWRNAAKRALIYESTHTIQVRPAQTGYFSTGRDIGWAVLDTGIRSTHPHFQLHGNVKAQWDCTELGAPVEATGRGDQLDRHGHGTHVAGVIAGYLDVPFAENGKSVPFAGMAPETSLYGYKVLNDQGEGRDSWIVKALDHVAEVNDSAGKLVIHGVNLSLGGNFDPSVYACGHTPLCQELRRLWNQGVVVVLAAGNEGYAILQGEAGETPANMDISIGDPANLDEAIAVGSIHKRNPFTYGVSYFSSRGPTADGRRKPDVVAPGEQILSAYNGFNATKPQKKWVVSDLYVEMSGTSMAAPHVSGLLAAFLSLRREFIGYSNRLKEILLSNCTDLSRDVYVQGRGMPNLIKMLVNS